MDKPLLSVVIPVFNIEAHLRQCLDSIAGQSYRNLEIICVDDGSTDGSPEILSEYAERDPRFQIITQPNGGPGVARNTGMDRAAGTYLIFLDSDDWFEPDFLEVMADRAMATGADVTICRADEFDSATGTVFPGDWMLKEQYLPGDTFSPTEVAEHLFQFTYGMPWDKLYLRTFLCKTGLRFPNLHNSEDLAFVFLSVIAANKITVLGQILIHHRVGRNASVSNGRSSHPQDPWDAFKIVQDYLCVHGLMDVYKKSFLNWAMEFVVWHVSNMDDVTVQKDYFRKLRQEWFPQLGFERYPASYYENKFTYCKYLLAKYAAYPIFHWVTNLYHAIKRRRVLWRRRN